MFTLTIQTDNDAFSNGGRSEVARILRVVSNKLELDLQDAGSIRDLNGNVVGGYELTFHELP